MVTKTISGSPLKRVLNRSLTWKESVGMAAPESVAIDKKYAEALKEFEAIPDFADDWEAEQNRYVALSQTMRGLETDLVEADEKKRNAHTKRIEDATEEAKKLAKDVADKHVATRNGATKALTGTCVELRNLLERMGKGLPDLQPDLDYAKQLAPAMKEFVAIVSRLKLVSGRFKAIEQYMEKLSKFPPETIEKLLEQGTAASKRYTDTMAGAEGQREKLLAKVRKLSPPPAKKQFGGLYGNDAVKMEKARTDFQKTIDELTDDEQAIIKGLTGSIAYFSGGDFKLLNHWIHMIDRYDRRREIVEKEQRGAKSQATPSASSADDDDKPVPLLPTRPTDETSGKTISIRNPGLVPASVLTGSEQSKVDDFLALNGQAIASRLRDMMNEHFGCFEFVNHWTVRLSRRRRLEFDIDMASSATEARLTLVNIGDPTYEH